MGNTTTTDSKVGLKLFFVCFKKEMFSAFLDPINLLVAYLLNENTPLLLATFKIDTGNLLCTVVASFFLPQLLAQFLMKKQWQYEVGVSFDF